MHYAGGIESDGVVKFLKIGKYIAHISVASGDSSGSRSNFKGFGCYFDETLFVFQSLVNFSKLEFRTAVNGVEFDSLLQYRYSIQRRAGFCKYIGVCSDISGKIVRSANKNLFRLEEHLIKIILKRIAERNVALFFGLLEFNGYLFVKFFSQNLCF